MIERNFTLPRREFLKASALAGSGLVLALTLPGCGRREPDAGTAKPRGGQPNAWLRIGGDDTITMIVERVEMGQGTWTALPQLLAEELAVPLERIRLEAAPVGTAYNNALLGGQVTGGSTSVRDTWTKMRTAGAQARTMLVIAAARRWGIDAAECRVQDGVIAADGREPLTYGQVAEEAARLPVPTDVKLKSPDLFILVGRPVRRLDSPGKVDGTAEFGIDVKLPGMLHAAVALPPELKATVDAVDSAAAEAMPGVRKVVNTGDAVVVVADHFWQAKSARDALVIGWTPGPAAALDNDTIRGTLRQAAASTGRPVRTEGDGAAGLDQAARIFKAVYEVPLLAHATLEPMNCTADVKPEGCDLYAPTQGPPLAQAAAAAAAGLKPDKVRVHTTLLGGGFGRRIEVDYVPAAVAASMAVGAPVKLIWTREDDTTHDIFRPPAWNEVSGGLDADGRLVAFKLHLTAPSITARLFPAAVETAVDAFAIEAAQNYLYEVPHVAVDYNRQEVGLDVGYWRSVSHVANCFTVEGFMDELAVAAGRDPFEFRRDLLKQQPRALAVLEEAARRAGWGAAPEGRHQGIALMEGYGSYLAQVAEVSVEDGRLRIHRLVTAVDCGRMVNPAIVESQIESGIVFGLTALLWGDITLKDGRVQEQNFDQYRLMRINEVPVLEVYLLASTEAPGGIGEPSTALVAPAVCNALYAATGQRVRSLPLARQDGLKV